MPVIATLLARPEAIQSLRRSLPGPGLGRGRGRERGAWVLVVCRTPDRLSEVLATRLVDAIVTPAPPPSLPSGARSEVWPTIRRAYPQIPWITFSPFRPDDGPALAHCREEGVALVLVEGVDNAVAGEMVARHSASAERARALADAIRVLRFSDPLQRRVWSYLLERVDRPLRTSELARGVGCSREHLSRQFGAGGAPNLKRVIDLSRVACAASLLRNPGYTPAAVGRILGFASASHLAATARRIAGVSSRGLAGLGPRGVLAAFARGKTRSRG